MWIKSKQSSLSWHFNTKGFWKKLPRCISQLSASTKTRTSSSKYCFERRQYLANFFLQISIIFPCIAFTAGWIRHNAGGLHFQMWGTHSCTAGIITINYIHKHLNSAGHFVVLPTRTIPPLAMYMFIISSFMKTPMVGDTWPPSL